jgi:hypothetical protein
VVPISLPKSVSAVITNFNTWSLTERCVRTLEQHAAGYLKEVIVIDGFSDEVGPDYVRKSCTVLNIGGGDGYYPVGICVALTACKGACSRGRP